MRKKIVIAGAGPAGLTAAYELLKNYSDKYEVIIFEKSATIGGISQTYNYNGYKIDIGGHRFFSKSDKVMNWWFNILPEQGALPYDYRKLGRWAPVKEGGPDPEKEDRVMLIRERLSRIFYKRKFFDYPISLSLKTIRNLGFFNTFLIGLSYMKSKFIKKDESTFEGFLVNRFGRRLYETFFKDYTHKVWGKWPSDLDAAWGAQRIKGLSLYKAVIHALKKLFLKNNNVKKTETSLIGQFWYPKYGPGQLWETVAEEIRKMGGKIVMETEVVGLFVNEKGNIGKIKVRSSDGGEEMIKVDYFISTMPIKQLINGIDKVPDDIKQYANGLEYRDFITVGLLVSRLKIKNETNIPTLNNIVPDNWIYIQERDVKVGRLQIFNNWSPYLLKDKNKVWIGMEYFANVGDELWSMENDEFIRFAIEELDKIGIIDKNDVEDSVILRVEKAYPAYFGYGYENFDKIKEYINSISNLYCVGRNGMHRYNNMDHSMLSAMEAVNNIVSGNNDKSNIWQVNAEQEYHEEKK